MLFKPESIDPAAIESRGLVLGHPITQDLLSNDVERAPYGEVNGEFRMYSMMCGAQAAEDGEIMVVRKDPMADSSSRSDWMVVRIIPDLETGEPKFNEEHVMAVSTYKDKQSAGDKIELMVSQDENYNRGPNIVSFAVDETYNPVDDQPINFGRLDRHGERLWDGGMVTKPIKTYSQKIPGVEYNTYQYEVDDNQLTLKVATRLGEISLEQAA